MRCKILMTMAIFAGCGDAIVGQGYLGTPTFELGGAIQQTAPPEGADEPQNLRLSLFWIGFDSRALAGSVVEQRTTLDAGLARFRMALFDRPPDEALRFDGGAARVGVALIVLYADQNGNDALNATLGVEGPDAVIGASATHVVAFASGPVAADTPAGRILGAVEPGYHLLENIGGNVCAFVEPAGCFGRGGLEPRAPTDRVVLTLSPRPDAVLVPDPQVDPSTSGTGNEGGSLYDGNP